FTVDNVLASDGNSTNATNAFIDEHSHSDITVIRSCKFQGIAGTEKLNVISGYTPQAWLLWENCVFENIVDPTGSPVPNERFVGCAYRTGSTVTLKDGIGTWT